MKAYHFLKADMRSGEGFEPPWRVGETRKYAGRIELCESGYHSSPSWLDALSYAPGSMACVVEVSEPIEKQADKRVSRTRTLIACANVEKELRLFACDCAERALLRERKQGREPDERSWEAIRVARAYANGQGSRQRLDAAWDAARDAVVAAGWDAASDAAWAAGWDAASATAWAVGSATAWATGSAAAWAATSAAGLAAASDAAWAAARAADLATAWAAGSATAVAAERDWQRERLAELLDAAIDTKPNINRPSKGRRRR